MNFKRFTFFLGLLLLPFSLINAQNAASKFAYDHIKAQQTAWGLTSTDISDLVISDQYTSQHNGVTHVYFIQQYQGVPIFNAVSGVHLKNNEQVVFSSNRFIAKVEEKVTSTATTISMKRALSTAAFDLGLPVPKVPQVLARNNKEMAFTDLSVSRAPIKTKQYYFPMPDGSLRLSWNVWIEDPRNTSGWNLFIDAQDGSILSKEDETIYCSFDHEHQDDCKEAKVAGLASFKINSKAHQLKSSNQQSINPRNLIDGASYFVFPYPVESPNHGERALVSNPADLIASPFGWHDTNAQDGPEYTTTRGNNVHAYRDAIPDDAPDGDEPEGGENLVFNFPYEVGGPPSENAKASVTQLFYMNNVIHDYVYQFGFDEASGNYQQNNYGNGGRGGDPIRAEAQDGEGINNANFLPSQDGTNGRMQMFLWSFGGSSNFMVESPGSLEGSYEMGTASFGPFISEAIEGDLVEGISASADPTTGCTPLAGADDIEGKIVLINRGDCFFEEKTINAEAAGAIACVICNNNPDGVIAMSGVDSIPDPNISTVMISQADCAMFRALLQSGGDIRVRIEAPDFLDSDFDNGIIIHEYGHGISTRLTGGPSMPWCLGNDEQMGEGWSDFFTLAMLAQEGDIGTTPKGIGTFPSGQPITGRGIRRLRYSTDINLNDQTYDDIIGTGAPHPLGEIWTGALWDLFWAMADEYGFNPDPTDKSAGNNLAVQLVMDGMKLQACRPGFIDGRDAIIAADFINNGGQNECLIWEVFARRGLGFSAEQGESRNRNDNFENFDTRPECLKNIKITKTSTPLINAGDTFTVKLTIRNDKESAVTNVVLTDQLPLGAEFIPFSTTGSAETFLNGDLVIFEIEALDAGGSLDLTYQLLSDPGLFSQQVFVDDIENGENNWRLNNLGGAVSWRTTTSNPNSGEQSWFIPNTELENDQALQTILPLRIDFNRPVLRFAHDFEIQAGFDGGILEFTTDGGNWIPASQENIFRNNYTGTVAESVFNREGQKAFWGNSEGYVTSYVDLSDFQNQSLRFRFRFSNDTEPENGGETTQGWYVDDIEVFDMFNYNTEVCLSTAEGDNVCATAEGEGTIVETGITTTTLEIKEEGPSIAIFPNPASNQVNIAVNGLLKEQLNIQLMSIDGRVLKQDQIAAGLVAEQNAMNIADLPKGVYLLQAQNANISWMEKLVIQ